MGDMERPPQGGVRTKKFNGKAKHSVGHHIDGVCGPMGLVLQDPPPQPDGKQEIKDDFQLSGGPVQGFGAEKRDSVATAADQTIDPRKEQRDGHANRERIRHLRQLALCELRARQIEQRHEKYAAEQAHSALSVFQKGEKLYAKKAQNRMQQGQTKRGKSRHGKAFAEVHQPEVGHQHGDGQKDIQDMVEDPSTYKPHADPVLSNVV